MRFTLTFGTGDPKTVPLDDLYTAVLLADALTAKGWLGVKITNADGALVPWRTLTTHDVDTYGSHTVNRGAW